MSEGRLRAGIALLAVHGAGVSAYLLFARHSGSELVCSTGGCETVQRSAYAEVLGLPIAALGLLAFLLLLGSALARGALARAAGAGLALAAVAFSGYLLVIQLTVIEAICDWCVASDAITTAIAALALLRLRGELVGQAGDRAAA
jgi:uncharacterized membrane protein